MDIQLEYTAVLNTNSNKGIQRIINILMNFTLITEEYSFTTANVSTLIFIFSNIIKYSSKSVYKAFSHIKMR